MTVKNKWYIFYVVGATTATAIIFVKISKSIPAKSAVRANR